MSRRHRLHLAAQHVRLVLWLKTAGLADSMSDSILQQKALDSKTSKRSTSNMRCSFHCAVKEDDAWVDSKPTPTDGTRRDPLLVLGSLPDGEIFQQQQQHHLSARSVDCSLRRDSETCTQNAGTQDGTEAAQPRYPLGHPSSTDACKGEPEGASINSLAA